MKVALNPAELRLIVDALDESLLLDHLAGLKKALQSYRGERVIFHGPSEFLARTGKKLGHGTQACRGNTKSGLAKMQPWRRIRSRLTKRKVFRNSEYHVILYAKGDLHGATAPADELPIEDIL